MFALIRAADGNPYNSARRAQAVRVLPVLRSL
jgi:hypothetical protein